MGTIASDIGVSNTILFILLQAGIMHVVNSASNDAATRLEGRKHFEECLANLAIVGKFRSTAVHYIKILRHLEEVNGKSDNAPISTAIIERSRMISRPGSPVGNNGDPFLGSTIQPDIEVQAERSDAQAQMAALLQTSPGFDTGIQNEYWSTMPLAGFDFTEWENWESFAFSY